MLIPLTVLFLVLAGIYAALQSRGVQALITHQVTSWMSKNWNVNIHIEGVDVAFFNRIVLENVWIEDDQSDTLAFARKISAHMNHLKFSRKHVGIKMLTIESPDFDLKRDSLGTFNFDFITNTAHKDSAKSGKWSISCNRFRLKNAGIIYSQATGEPLEYRVDDLNLRIGAFVASPDSFGMHVASLSLIDSRGFFLNDLSASVSARKGDVFVRNLSLNTLRSRIDSASISYTRKIMADSLQSIPEYSLSLPEATINLADIALFIPALEGMDQQVKVAGNISGNPENLSIKNLQVSTGQHTFIHCDIDLNQPKGMDEPYLFVDIKGLQTDFTDLSQIRMPNSAETAYIRFPSGMYKSGLITYRGNLTGFVSDFVAYGTINSRMGQIKSDLSVVPQDENNIRFNGRLETADFDLGELLQFDNVGNVTFSSNVNGKYNKRRNSFNGTFNGVVSQIFLNQYNYSNIQLNGKLNNRRFDGSASIDDPNLNMNFIGVLNLNEKIPIFDFIMNLKQANLVALHLDPVNSRSDLSLSMTANFSGSNIDNFDGLVQIFNGNYLNQNDSLEFENMTINTHLGPASSQVNLTSDFINGSITGTYHFRSLFDSFRGVLAGYLPVLGMPAKGIDNTNQFTFNFEAIDLTPITSVFNPGLEITTPFSLSGKIDSNLSTMELKGKIPGIRFETYSLKDIDINISPAGKELTSRIRVSEASLQNELVLFNLALLMNAADNRISSRIVWNNWDKITYSGEIESDITFSMSENQTKPAVNIEFKPSTIIMADSVWQILPSTARIDSSAISVNNFSFINNRQEVTINGKISSNKEEMLSLHFRQIDLRYIESYMKQSEGLKGVINGSIGISDFYGNRLFFSDLKVAGFEFREQEFGDISLVSQWDRNSEMIKSDLKVEKNKRFPLLASGFYDPKNNTVDYNVKFDNQSLFFLNALIRETFSNFHGDGTGSIRVHGTPRKILLDGSVFCLNAGLSIDFTQVAYTLSDSIRFKEDRLVFDQIRIKDLTGNEGIFNGTIRHDNFGNMDYNLSVRSNKIMAMNTTMGPDNPFYGTALVRGNILVTGHGINVRLAGDATSLPGTSVTIVLDDETEVAQYDFIRFLSPEIEDEKKPLFLRTAEEGGMEIDFLIHATPEARVQLVYNTQISDMIRAQGEGTLRFAMDKKGNITLAGIYVLEDGEYLFTLQDVINKRFTVEPGGTLTWSGNPYDAVLELNAVYSLKASLYELLSGSVANFDSKQRIPVECKIKLTGDLMSPDISFDIAFPEIESRLRDELQQFFATQEDMNRQMLSLLVLGKFYTPEYVRGNYDATSTGLIGNTASDLFSNQLSNWLSQINKDVDVGVKYRPGDQMTNDEIELALSTQIFNDRVSINGNIGNNVNPRRVNNSELVGDFDVNVKLSRNGKLQLKFYNRSNNNLIYETAPYTQGLGVSYKEDYNTFGELLRKFISLFKKNEN